MAIFWYLVMMLCGALGALGVLRAVERVVFGGGSGSVAVQFGMGLGLLFLAVRARRKAIAARRPQSAAQERTS